MTGPPERLVRGRLVLRKWRRTDAVAQAAAVHESLDHLRPWMPWAADEPTPIEDRRAMLARWERDWQAGDTLSYGMFVDRQVVGGASLMRRIGAGGRAAGLAFTPYGVERPKRSSSSESSRARWRRSSARSTH